MPTSHNRIVKSCVTSRINIPAYLNQKGLTGIAVEVGVWRGDFSEPFIKRWHGSKLVLVDLWQKLDDYDDLRNLDYDPNDYQLVVSRFVKYQQRVEIYRISSYEAVSFLSDQLLDFVYIDANHSYKCVKEDIQVWWPLIRPGGVLSGHDLWMPGYPGVTTALIEFLNDKGLIAQEIPGDYNTDNQLVNAASWLIDKPK